MASFKVAFEVSLFKFRDFKYIFLSLPKFSICFKREL